MHHATQKNQIQGLCQTLDFVADWFQAVSSGSPLGRDTVSIYLFRPAPKDVQSAGQ